MPEAVNSPIPAPAAVSAFLRGVERRGMVLAELQAGDGAIAEKGLTAAMRAFRSHAADLAMADWPARFWKLLASTPPLRQPSAYSLDLPVFGALQVAAPLPRLALLLRLAAGLEEAEAAAAMGVALPDYQQALAEACPRDAEGAPDVQAWRRLAEAIQQRLRDLPPARLAHLARLREAAIAGSAPPPAPPRPVAEEGRQHTSGRGRAWRWAILVLALCLLGLAATWWTARRPQALPAPLSDGGDAVGVTDRGPIVIEPLDPAEPAAVEAIPSALDADLAADPAGVEQAREADFYAWYAAGAPVPAAVGESRSDQITAPEPAEDSHDASL